MVGLLDAAGAVDDAARGKIGTRHVVHQIAVVQLGVVDERAGGVHHLRQIVRRNVGGHTHRDSGGAVDHQGRHLGGQHDRLGHGFIVIGLKVDRLLVQIFEHLVRDLRHAHFGVAHGRGRVAVHRSEVALAVDQGVAHGKVLGHAHDGVVHGHVAVGVVFTNHVTDDARRFFVRLVVVVSEFAHREKHAAMNRFEAIAHVGQRAPDDHAHGIIEIGFFHLPLDAYRGSGFGLGHSCHLSVKK